ncbi:unnamed protein product [marine sediment metagenome]|uniref:Uncharacterized protein n=1 Tax=marine sediment metagenome TaxID=412755 RepID=X1BMC5_9ZZZZ
MSDVIKNTYFPRDVIFNILSFFEVTIHNGNNLFFNNKISIGLFNFNNNNKVVWLSTQEKATRDIFKDITEIEFICIQFKLKLLNLYGKWGSKQFKGVYWLYRTIKLVISRGFTELTNSVFKEDMNFLENFTKSNRNLFFEYVIWIPENFEINECIEKDLLKRGFKKKIGGIFSVFTKKIKT